MGNMWLVVQKLHITNTIMIMPIPDPKTITTSKTTADKLPLDMALTWFHCYCYRIAAALPIMGQAPWLALLWGFT